MNEAFEKWWEDNDKCPHEAFNRYDIAATAWEAATSQWQPIETAPKDGTLLLKPLNKIMSNLKRKVDDTVTIRKDLKITHSITLAVIESMLQYAGKKAKIIRANEYNGAYPVFYKLELDPHSSHDWTDDMFEDYETLSPLEPKDIVEHREQRSLVEGYQPRSNKDTKSFKPAETKTLISGVKPASQSVSKEKLPEAPKPLFEFNEVIMHVKTKGLYIVISIPTWGRIEATGEPAYGYVALDEDALPCTWYRSQKEMEDGRFVAR